MQEIIKKYKEKYSNYEGDIGNIEAIIYMLISYITHIPIGDIKLGKLDWHNIDMNVLDDNMKNIFEKHIPIQYIIGKTYLYNEEYIVSDAVLIPRQDTETLIEESIKCIDKNNFSMLLDICTGSGAVGISISKNSSIKECILIDVSKKALNIAKKNIELNSAEKCSTIYSDMFSNLPEIAVDIIVSNPPYISRKEMNEISPFVKNEPVLALLGGESGLDFYECIYKNSPSHLNEEGYILVEIGCKQAEAVKNIIMKYDVYDNIEVIKDINGKDRVIKCRFHKI